jgi:hypothetical protein
LGVKKGFKGIKKTSILGKNGKGEMKTWIGWKKMRIGGDLARTFP